VSKELKDKKARVKVQVEAIDLLPLILVDLMRSKEPLKSTSTLKMENLKTVLLLKISMF